MPTEKLDRSRVGSSCRGGIVVSSAVTSERMSATGVAMDFNLWFVGQSVFDLLLCLGRNELVRFRPMHEQRCANIDCFGEKLFRAAAVPRDARIDVGTSLCR